MTNEHEYLDSKLTDAVTEFKGNAGKIKSGSTWDIPGVGKQGPYDQKEIDSALNGLFKKTNSLGADLIQHYKDMDKLVPLCSTPPSFSAAWKKRYLKTLTKNHISDLTKVGGQLHLENRDKSDDGIKKFVVEMKYNKKYDELDTAQKEEAEKLQWKNKIISGTKERLFTTRGEGASGVVPGYNNRFIKFVRHSRKGQYSDEMNNYFQLDYQPPESLTGALRYRWMECVSRILNLKLIATIVNGTFVHNTNQLIFNF